jgi:hypothetical protein
MAEFFDNISLQGIPIFKRVDARINFNWNGDSPAPVFQARIFPCGGQESWSRL